MKAEFLRIAEIPTSRGEKMRGTFENWLGVVDGDRIIDRVDGLSPADE